MDLSTSSLILMLACLLTMGAHTVYASRQGRFLTLDPLNVFWAGFIVVYFVEAIEQASVMHERHARGTMEWALIWVLFSIVSVIIGYESRLGPTWAKRWPRIPAAYVPSRVSAAGILLLGIGLTYYVEAARSAGGLDAWLSVGRGATDFTQISGYLGSLEPGLMLGVTLLLLKAETLPTSLVQRAIVWSAGLLLTLFYAYLGSRSRLLLTVLGLACAYYLPRRRNPPAPLALIALVVLLVISNFLAQNRGNFTNLSFNIEGSEMPELIGRAAMGARSTASLGRGSELDCVMTVIELVPDSIDFNYGYGLLELLTRPIPSAIWPDKIYPGLEAVFHVYFQGDLSDWWVQTASGPLLAGPALTFVGYWYAAGGPLALFVAGVITGALFRAIRVLYDDQVGFGVILLYMLLLRIPFGDAVSTPLDWVFNLPFAFIAIAIIIRLTREGSARWGATPVVSAPPT